MRYEILDNEVQKMYYHVKMLLDSQGYTQQLGLYIHLGMENQPFAFRWRLPFPPSRAATEKATEKPGSHRLMKIIAEEMSKESSKEQIAEALKKEIEETLKKVKVPVSESKKQIAHQLLGILLILENGEKYFFGKYSEAGSLFKGLTDFKKAEEAAKETKSLYAEALKKLDQISSFHSMSSPLRSLLERRIKSLSKIEEQLYTKWNGKGRLVDQIVYLYRDSVKREKSLIERIRREIRKDL